MISHVLAVLFFIASLVFIWRSFYGMRIGALKAEVAEDRSDRMAAD
jgi:hypothetical protein